MTERLNWSELKVYPVMIWFTYISQNDYHNRVGNPSPHIIMLFFFLAGTYLLSCNFQVNNTVLITMVFPDSSVGKESTCNAGDPTSIPGSGRSAGEGTGYPLQYSWASLEAQLVKILPAVWEIWVWSLGWEGPLEKGKATHSSILAWRIPWTV